MKFKSLLLSILCAASLAANQVQSESVTLQDIVNATAPLPTVTIYVAKEVVTLDPNKPSATAVAVVGDRILATGTLEQLKAAAGDQPYTVDETFSHKVIVPGFIAQHDHPLLTALTMAARRDKASFRASAKYQRAQSPIIPTLCQHVNPRAHLEGPQRAPSSPEAVGRD